MNNATKHRLLTRSDFDGLVCAVLLKERGLIEEITFVHPKDMQDGKVPVDENVRRLFPNVLKHDPRDLTGARDLVAREGVIPVGLLYRKTGGERYDHATKYGLGMSAAKKVAAVETEFDRFLIDEGAS